MELPVVHTIPVPVQRAPRAFAAKDCEFLFTEPSVKTREANKRCTEIDDPVIYRGGKGDCPINKV